MSKAARGIGASAISSMIGAGSATSATASRRSREIGAPSKRVIRTRILVVPCGEGRRDRSGGAGGGGRTVSYESGPVGGQYRGNVAAVGAKIKRPAGRRWSPGRAHHGSWGRRPTCGRGSSSHFECRGLE